MRIPQRKAVSPIIATLLLIAITVAAGVVVYVFVGGLSSSLAKSGGNQVTEQISQDAYVSSVVGANATNSISLVLRNTGSGAVTVSSVYIDGVALTEKVVSPVLSIPVTGAGNPTTIALAPSFTTGVTNSNREWFSASFPTLTSGTTHQVKVVTLDGAIFTFNIVAGSSG